MLGVALVWIAVLLTALRFLFATRLSPVNRFVALFCALFALLGLQTSAEFFNGGRRGPGTRCVISMHNLKQIAQYCWGYANDSPDGRFPPNLQVVAETWGTAGAAAIRSPGWSLERMPACGYYYVPSVRPGDPCDWILAHDDPKFYAGKWAAILYADGHVRRHRTAAYGNGDFERVIAAFIAEYEAARGEPPVFLPPK
jgi:prepilin-type processing-associated H-X9-DG protein